MIWLPGNVDQVQIVPTYWILKFQIIDFAHLNGSQHTYAGDQTEIWKVLMFLPKS